MLIKPARNSREPPRVQGSPANGTVAGVSRRMSGS